MDAPENREIIAGKRRGGGGGGVENSFFFFLLTNFCYLHQNIATFIYIQIICIFALKVKIKNIILMLYKVFKYLKIKRNLIFD